MKSLLIIPLAILALLAPLNASADFGKGVAAYASGEYATAAKEFKKAAEQGDGFAQFNLGIMYDNGKGVIQDNAYAHAWSNIAASEGHKNAKKNRDIIAKKMTPV